MVLRNYIVHDLPIRPVVSNVGTASYHLAKYFSKVLSPWVYSD